MEVQETYKEICTRLEYDEGLVENISQASSPLRRQLFSEAQRQIEEFDTLYFSGDVPIIYFKQLTEFNEDKIKELHRRIWNQNRVPLLYVITPGELRIYDCFNVLLENEGEHLDEKLREIGFELISFLTFCGSSFLEFFQQIIRGEIYSQKEP